MKHSPTASHTPPGGMGGLPLPGRPPAFPGLFVKVGAGGRHPVLWGGALRGLGRGQEPAPCARPPSPGRPRAALVQLSCAYPAACLTESAPPAALQTQDGPAVTCRRPGHGARARTRGPGPDFCTESIYPFCMRVHTRQDTTSSSVTGGHTLHRLTRPLALTTLGFTDPRPPRPPRSPKSRSFPFSL